MSKYTRLSRPRTKVYDTNYNIGESYYKSALDGIDRKYGRPTVGTESTLGMPMTQSVFGKQPEMSSMRNNLREIEDDFFGDRKKGASSLLGSLDLAFNEKMRNGIEKERTPMTGIRALEDEIEEDMASSMRRLKAVKIAKSMADEFEEEATMAGMRSKAKMDFSDKMMDSVGLSARARAALEDEGMSGRRRLLKMVSDSGESEDLTKWTALKPTLPRKYTLEDDDEMSSTAAAMRARKSRARLEDLESEMQALSEKSAAREKRVRDLKALVQENEMNAMDNLHSTVKVKASIQSEKKVTF